MKFKRIIVLLFIWQNQINKYNNSAKGGDSND